MSTTAPGAITLLNYSHPLTPEQHAQIETLAGQTLDRILDLPSQVDPTQPLPPQIKSLLDQAELTPLEWQTLPLLVILPALNFSAAVMLAEIHARMGHFPAIVRLRPVPNTIPIIYQVAELIDLQTVRDQARTDR
ncbi:MAG TPA: CRISPR-associated protein Csx15 [Anaerolineaceae bacterium]|nr:CRISPR-associated protein Csx15 [Anaerolineaceae bacterium]